MDFGTNGGSALDFATFMNSALRNNEDGMWSGNGGLLWIFLLILFWGNGGMWGNRNGQPTDVAVREAVEKAVAQARADGLSDQVIVDAVKGNAAAIQQLANTLNCDMNTLQNAICQVQSSIQGVGNQVGMSGQQIINAIQAGNCQISHQIADCCCNVRTAITTQGYENQLATINQTNALQSTMNGNNQAILARLDAMSNQALLDKIDALREKNSSLTAQLSNEHQTAAIQAYQAQSLIPVNAALQDLSTRLGAIECKQPATVTVPYIPAMSNLVPVSYSQPVNFSTVGYNTCGC